jgi:uncharacterized membrane protein YeaQ/YmgE (transglycosylase-associated protein family)
MKEWRTAETDGALAIGLRLRMRREVDDPRDSPAASGFSLSFPVARSAAASIPGVFNMNITALIIQLVSGAIGGNLAGLLAKAKSLGPLLNTILGAAGGAGGGQILSQIFKDGIPGGNAGNAGLSAILGAILPLVAGFLKKKPV